MSIPKIFVFSAVGGGDGICYAMAEDGTILGSHWCSHEGYAPGDLGAGRGENVILSSDGAATRKMLKHDNTPVRWMVLGIAD